MGCMICRVTDCMMGRECRVTDCMIGCMICRVTDYMNVAGLSKTGSSVQERILNNYKSCNYCDYLFEFLSNEML
jgi:hypothetical protein